MAGKGMWARAWSAIRMDVRGAVVAAVVGGLVAGMSVSAASAQSVAGDGGPRVATDHVTTTLVAEGPARPGQPLWLAFEQKLIPDWHTYWVNPGDSGLPTEITWTLPTPAWRADAPLFPAPHRFTTGPLVNYGYADHVTLLARVDVPADARPGLPVHLNAAVAYLVCADVCVPENITLGLDVPVVASTAPAGAGGGADPATAALFADARAALAVDSPYAATVDRAKDRLTLRLAAPGLSAASLKDAYFYAEDPDQVEAGAPQTLAIDGQGLRLTLKPTGRGAAGPLAGILELTEQVNGQPVHQALKIAAAPMAAGAAAAPAAGGGMADLPLWQAMLFACLGGMVLNLMPCVFPVLSMKAMALIKHKAEHARIHGLVYTAGVLTCFATVAGVLMALRAGGAEIGWGFQLQSPPVVLVLSCVMFLLGLSMSGVFEVGGGFMGAGQSLTQGGGYAPSFFTGVLATVVATPCTAPFMGAAVGFALVQPWPVALSVFLALGFGMALPFLALTFSPWLLRHMPRPGLWMERFKQVLAFPLYGSAAWLVWVLGVQAGPGATADALIALLLVAFGAWVYGVTRLSGTFWRRAGGVLALVALAGVSAIVVPLIGGAPPAAAGAGPAATTADGPARFSTAELQRLRTAGQPVLVDFTAAWCITCLVNERVALSSDTVHQAMDRSGTVLLKGDWTNQDAEITRVLQEHGRSGVPLYLLYRPGVAEPEVLPQILSESLILEKLADLAPRRG